MRTELPEELWKVVEFLFAVLDGTDLTPAEQICVLLAMLHGSIHAAREVGVPLPDAAFRLGEILEGFIAMESQDIGTLTRH